MLVSAFVTTLCIGGSPGATAPDPTEPASAGGATPTTADPALPPNAVVPSDERWEFYVTPYLWMFGMDGDVRIRNTSAEFEVGFDDIFENLDVAAIVDVEARKDRFGLYADSVYGQVSAEGKSGVVDVEVETDLLLLDFGALYRVFDRRTESGRARLAEMSIGGRYVYTDNRIDFANVADRGKSNDFVDLTVGARYAMDLTDRLGFLIEGDVGGFGLGSSSEFSWNVAGLLSWSFERAGRLWAGYRLLDIDQDDGGSTGYDLRISGPLIGYEFVL